jgi:transcriptional regulator with XRE-family HTH domain
MTVGVRIRRARVDAKLSQAALAKVLGVTRNAVSIWEAGGSPSSEHLRNAAVALNVSYEWLATGRGAQARGRVPGLRLLGTVAAGLWSEVPELQENLLERVPVAPDTRYPADAQYALRVQGTSIDKVAPNGSIIAVVDIAAAGIEPRVDDLVCVERRRGSLVETSVKRVKRGRKGLELWPESTDPQQKPLLMADGKSETTVEIKALVIGIYMPIARGT